MREAVETQVADIRRRETNGRETENRAELPPLKLRAGAGLKKGQLPRQLQRQQLAVGSFNLTSKTSALHIYTVYIYI